MSEKNDNRIAEQQAEKILHQGQFANAYRKVGTVGGAMKEIGLARSTFFYWLKNDPDFYAIYQELKSDRIDTMVSKLYAFVADENCGYKLNQQQLLAAFFLLKAFDPKTFQDKLQMQHVGQDGAPAKVTTVEIHRAQKPNNGSLTEEQETANADTDSPEV